MLKPVIPIKQKYSNHGQCYHSMSKPIKKTMAATELLTILSSEHTLHDNMPNE